MKVESENLPIGLFEDLSRTCSMLEIRFTGGDRLILYTDGVTESTNRQGLTLGVEGFGTRLGPYDLQFPPRRRRDG